MEWRISGSIERIGDMKIRVDFHHNNELIGSVEVGPQSPDSFDFVFVEFVKDESKWQVSDLGLRAALVVYHQETAAGVDYRKKSFRFIPSNAHGRQGEVWKLTTDKSDIRIPLPANESVTDTPLTT
jgi:hypothetical protein